ncbi:MAG: hypothetical protein EP343_20265 [Deltaproteobacteria bacterium]|nr:MAG: hypothetical protein EP343_20265 [Deltaproteobacteria bacterium]
MNVSSQTQPIHPEPPLHGVERLKSQKEPQNRILKWVVLGCLYLALFAQTHMGCTGASLQENPGFEAIAESGQDKDPNNAEVSRESTLPDSPNEEPSTEPRSRVEPGVEAPGSGKEATADRANQEQAGPQEASNEPTPEAGTAEEPVGSEPHPPEGSPDATSATGCSPLPSWTYKAGATYWGRKNYIQYLAGDLPLILSAPHGGTIKPSEIPARTYGTTVLDTGSHQLSLEVAHEIYRLTGKRPHLIICRLSRTRLDANRDIKEAAQGNPWAEQAWKEFHSFIDAAKQWVTQQCKHGHYFDLHTHGHSTAWAELGYRLSSKELTLSDAALNSSSQYASKSSIKHLASRSPLKFAALLRGTTSFGGILENGQYQAVPSPKNPDSGGKSYFNGGYNTERHGSKLGGVVDGTQIESASSILGTGSKRRPYAAALAQSMIRYLETHYGFSLLLPKPVPPPAHSKCVNAKLMSFTSGKVVIQGSTWGALNEYGTKVSCSHTSGFAGGQVYYKFPLKAGSSYTFALQPTFPSRLYLFGDTCNETSIQSQCKTSGIEGALVATQSTFTRTIQPKQSGAYTLAVDSLQEAWYGTFTLTVTENP